MLSIKTKPAGVWSSDPAAKNRKWIIIFNGVSEGVYTHVCRYSRRLETLDPPGFGVTDSSEPPDVGSGNGAQVLWKSNISSNH